MKRWLVFLCFFSTILASLSILIYIGLKSRNISQQNALNNVTEQIKLSEEELKAGQTIRVRFSKTSEVVAMDINDYLMGVVPAEMPPYYNIEALKAQAVVARTYTYKRMEGGAEGVDADICDNYAHCQAYYTKEKLFSIWKSKGYDEKKIEEYWNNVKMAVSETQGVVITYNGEYIKAFFHASSPIKTEDSTQIWGKESLPYLVSVESIEDPRYIYNRSEVDISKSEFQTKVDQNIDSNFNVNSRSLDSIIKIENYTISGRVKEVKIGDNIISAEKMRTIFGLRSTNFTVVISGDTICFKVIGNGHGLGMSQVGANYYASIGYSCEDIIKHYYTGVEVLHLGN